MSHTASARATTHRTPRTIAVGLVVVTVAIIGTFVHQSASSSAPSFSAPLQDQGGVAVEAGGAITTADGAITEADGVLPDGVTVFDGGYPGIANLDADLLQTLRAAATDAADDGIEFHVNSGWRSPEYQNQLLREAVSEYGSAEEAARWVATADTSAHVSGNAVDVGSSRHRGVAVRTWRRRTGSARSTATSPGTTNCAPRRSIVVALRCTTTPRTIRGCSGDRRRPVRPLTDGRYLT